MEDGTPATEAQIERSAFLDGVSEAVREAAAVELARVGRSAADCPYLAYWLGFYRDKPASRIEQAIERYARPAAPDHGSLKAAIVARTRAAIASWIASGRMDAPVPLDASNDGLGAHGPEDAPGDPATRGARAEIVRSQLGAGSALDPSTRARMEHALGHDLGGARLHTDARAASLAHAQSAAAFTVGQSIAFAAGRYRPGTLAGDAMLAHELAHTVQQKAAKRGPSNERGLESNANELAARALARLHASRVLARAGRHAPEAHALAQLRDRPAARPLASPLRLQRCSAVDEIAQRQYEAPRLQPASTAPLPAAAADVPDPAALVSAAESGWSRVTDDSMLAVQAQNRLFLVPSRFFVSQGTGGPLAAAPSPDPSRRPVAGMPAVGHGSLQLVNVGGGAGVLLDAGGAGGPTRAILPGSLTALMTSLGVDRIEGVLLVHTHADHVRHLVELVRSGSIQGNNVFIWPGWEQARTGPWAAVLTALRDASLTASGFGPTWSPTRLNARTVGTTGTELTVGTLRVGAAELSTVTLTSALRAYVGDLQGNRTGSSTADASSMLTRVRVPGAADVLVVGDLRGRTISQIRTQMDAAGTRFDDWVSQVRVVVGFHHLGDVATAADTAGYRDLLRSLPVGQGVTVVAQANPAKVNADFVQRLQASGIRVVVLPEADANALRQFTLSQSGRVNAPGASVFEASGAAAEAEQRIGMLRDAAAVLRNPTVVEPLFTTGSAAASASLADALEAEATALEQQVRGRRSLEITGVESGTRQQDYTQLAAASDVALRARGAQETAIGASGLTQLARLRPRSGELATLLREVATTGTSKPELRRLIEEVGPDLYREVLARNEPPPESPSAAREHAIRRSLVELLRQRDLLRATQTGGAPAGAFGRGVAGVLALVELANAILPYVARARDAANASATQRMLSLVGALGWWARLGLNVPFQATAGGVRLTPDTIVPAILRRVWEGSPPMERVAENELQENVRKAAPLDSLTIPSVANWPTAFWALLVERLTTLIPTWNEWSRWLDDDPGVGIRAVSDDVTTSPWQALTGTFDWDGSSNPNWEPSDALTRIMNARASAARSGTTTWLAQETEVPAPHPRSQQPTMGTPSTDRPTRRGVTFRPSASRAAVSPYGVRQVKGVSWNTNPTFVLYENTDAPPSMVWVTGADEATYRVIRNMRVWSYDPNAVVQLVRPLPSERTYGEAAGTAPVAFDWADSHGTPEQKAAVALVRAQAPGAEYVAYSQSDHRSSSYYGEIRFAAERPNTSGMILLSISDLDLGAKR